MHCASQIGRRGPHGRRYQASSPAYQSHDKSSPRGLCAARGTVISWRAHPLTVPHSPQSAICSPDDCCHSEAAPPCFVRREEEASQCRSAAARSATKAHFLQYECEFSVQGFSPLRCRGYNPAPAIPSSAAGELDFWQFHYTFTSRESRLALLRANLSGVQLDCALHWPMPNLAVP